jgi:hypothetical protein
MVVVSPRGTILFLNYGEFLQKEMKLKKNMVETKTVFYKFCQIFRLWLGLKNIGLVFTFSFYSRLETKLDFIIFFWILKHMEKSFFSVINFYEIIKIYFPTSLRILRLLFLHLEVGFLFIRMSFQDYTQLSFFFLRIEFINKF